uniref:hypothetical protein n=1 Tax=Altererythrobacter segetis TaxID=1104773 RepID=UPI001409FF4B|nr:hypothetical protein [Altererythrobacter segetis]
MFTWFRRALVPALACLALSGCFLQPGKFDSTLDLRKDGSFTFAYKGQIYLLALSKMADMAGKAETAGDQFVAEACHDDNFDERTCTAEELTEQKRAWEEGREKKKLEDQKNAEMMRAMLGGIDPADPEAARELAERLRHQAGWRSVTYVGDGLFEVDFALSSKLTHDFAFPTIERFPMANAFVMANRRADGTVRIDAPGFTAQSATNPLQAMMSGALGTGMSDPTANSDAGAAAVPNVPEIDGTFRLVTDGEILANNTDEGPRAGTGGKVLQWRITKRTQVMPLALVRLVP